MGFLDGFRNKLSLYGIYKKIQLKHKGRKMLGWTHGKRNSRKKSNRGDGIKSTARDKDD